MRLIRLAVRPTTIALLTPAALILAACEPTGGLGATDPSPNAQFDQQINEPTDGLQNEVTVE